MKTTPLHPVSIPCLALGLYWAVATRHLNKPQKRELSGERAARIVLMTSSFVLLLSREPCFGFLNLRFVPSQLRVVMLRIAMAVAGTARDWRILHARGTGNGRIRLYEQKRKRKRHGSARNLARHVTHRPHRIFPASAVLSRGDDLEQSANVIPDF